MLDVEEPVLVWSPAIVILLLGTYASLAPPYEGYCEYHSGANIAQPWNIAGSLELPKVTRKLFHVGALHTISFAVEADGVTSPAEEAFKLMLTGMWEEDPEAAEEGLPSDTQISRRAKLVAGIKYFARHGVPSWSACGMNALNSGVWEFKEGEKRISFFDTDGFGSFAEKRKIKDPALADFDDEFWEIPAFDRDVRLGHCFGKPWGQRTTEQEDLDETIRVREEDLSHDRAA